MPLALLRRVYHFRICGKAGLVVAVTSGIVPRLVFVAVVVITSIRLVVVFLSCRLWPSVILVTGPRLPALVG